MFGAVHVTVWEPENMFHVTFWSALPVHSRAGPSGYRQQQRESTAQPPTRSNGAMNSWYVVHARITMLRPSPVNAVSITAEGSSVCNHYAAARRGRIDLKCRATCYQGATRAVSKVASRLSRQRCISTELRKPPRPKSKQPPKRPQRGGGRFAHRDSVVPARDII